MLTLDRVRQLIQSSQPRASFSRGPAMALAGLAMLGIFVLLISTDDGTDDNPLLQSLLPVMMVALVLPTIFRRRREQRQSRLMMTGFEAVQMRQWSQAGEALTGLLSQTVPHPRARVASLLALAAVAEAELDYDASQHIYETLLEEGQGDPLQMHAARVALIAAMFRTGQVADAVSMSDRLARAELHGPLKAQAEMLALFREVVMGQTQDSLEHADERRQIFRRHLGTRAAYGYGLLAAAFDRAGKEEAARQEWQNATLLVRPDELLQRFGELEFVSQKYPPTEWPI